ncbi:hypothetical protein KSF_104260 [Reticulibacter mediterranei]|uniref:Uncharacterized protein n=1 Tax=Reticulibacter mediterranei TaxID=2778369 RepID=A0A8J3IXN5_9CHLR|nr:hypothetical protein [Reticulibacter mediterranei]GHP00379.1 hypothetical protein KSF_104260 [Reticulibacter mediterranei]
MMADGAGSKQEGVAQVLSRHSLGMRLVYVTALAGQQMSKEALETLAWVSEQRGEAAWEGALMLLVCPPSTPWNRAVLLAHCSRQVRRALATRVGWDGARGVATVLIEGSGHPLTDATCWLKHFTLVASTYELIVAETREQVQYRVAPLIGAHQTRRDCSLVHPPALVAGMSLLSGPLSVLGLLMGGLLGYVVALLFLFLMVMSVVLMCSSLCYKDA